MTIGRVLRRMPALRVFVFTALACLVLGASGFNYLRASLPRNAPDALLRVRPASDEAAESVELIGFLENRLRRDPGDSASYSRVARLYLQRLRETGALADLALAENAAHRSLAAVPAVRNVDGLTSLALAEFASHQFASARDHARQLARLDGSEAPYALLGDALLELGDYSQAQEAYREMRQRGGGDDENVATRTARLLQLRGDNAGAEESFRRALAIELLRDEPSRERIAWFHWQVGETAFFAGDDRTAQDHYDDALRAYPHYFRALASLGRLAAAHGDFARAIDDYKAAIDILPDPTFVAELGDVYALSGHRHEADIEYGLVRLIGRLNTLNGVMYNRQLAIFYADHDLHRREAYDDATREYRVRRDILGADAVAWTALKAGKIRVAQAAIAAALRLGTRDPRLLYHAGMIARAAGRERRAETYLREALALNPQFDPLQSQRAREALNAERAWATPIGAGTKTGAVAMP